MKEYCIVTDYCHETFGRKVTNLLQDGWTLYGAATVLQPDKYAHYYQAMTRGVQHA